MVGHGPDDQSGKDHAQSPPEVCQRPKKLWNCSEQEDPESRQQVIKGSGHDQNHNDPDSETHNSHDDPTNYVSHETFLRNGDLSLDVEIL